MVQLSSYDSQQLDDGVLSVVSREFLEDDDDEISAVGNRETERRTLARKENKAVSRMRCIVFVVLLLTTIFVSWRVYTYVRADQIQNFETAFASDASKLIESFRNAVERRIEAIDSLSVSITSFAMATGATFPNVTLPDFGVRCANSRVLSGSVFIQYSPLVTDAQRLGWEAYQVKHRDYWDAALMTEFTMLKEQDILFNQSHDGRTLQQATEVLRDRIENLSLNGTNVVAPEGTGPYLPLWQNSPVTPNKALLNFNSLSHPAAARGYNATIHTGQAVIEAASNLIGEHLGRTGLFFKAMLSMSQYRYDIEEYLGDPVSTLGYPVFDTLNLTTRKVVGVIGSSLYWRLYFKNVLSSHARGVICVLENTKNQTFSYRIDDKVVYLGVGDHHDPKYNHLVKESDVASYISSTSAPETKSFTSVPLNTEYCTYKLRIYPSKTTEELYTNRDPIYVTMILIGVFLLTSVVFILFTITVNRRQRVVMDRAVASSAIVSSLFPSQIRDQIYEANETDTKKKNWKQDGSDDTADLTAAKSSPVDQVPRTSRPIANIFEHTTIMFADIVGFTAWSSSREPVQVFELLETLYQAFDVIAVRRKVFKVETIGDCYVAVAGLPEPQEDHAVIMAKFAGDCIAKMLQLTTELSDVLGPETARLSMRVGLHSGSVTGGVLRGQKSRFQLFGDTVNTAARMESNGSPGLIHVSQETATALIAKGKMSWVTPRKEKVFAKGKGELQTFWVQPKSTVQSIKSRSSTDVPVQQHKARENGTSGFAREKISIRNETKLALETFEI